MTETELRTVNCWRFDVHEPHVWRDRFRRRVREYRCPGTRVVAGGERA